MKQTYICMLCKLDKGMPKKFSSDNMVPILPGLNGLAKCEMLIGKVFPVMQVYVRPKYGYLTYKGHVITSPYNILNITF